MAGEFSFVLIVHRLTRDGIDYRPPWHMIWPFKFGAQHVTLCNLTCSDRRLYSFDFISHAERKNAEDLVRCSKHAAAAVIFLFFDGW